MPTAPLVILGLKRKGRCSQHGRHFVPYLRYSSANHEEKKGGYSGVGVPAVREPPSLLVPSIPSAVAVRVDRNPKRTRHSRESLRYKGEGSRHEKTAVWVLDC